MLPSIHIEPLRTGVLPGGGYLLSTSHGRFRRTSMIGCFAVKEMHCDSSAVLEDYWINQTLHLKSWVMRFSSGASLTVLFDAHDQLQELDAVGFEVVSPHRYGESSAAPLHLQDCL